MEPVTLELINQGITTIILPILIAILGYVSSKFVKFINSKTNSIKDNIQNNKIKTYVDLTSNTVVDIVQAINQEVVKGMKEKSKDGKLTKEEALEIKNMAIDKTFSILSPEAIDALGTVFDDIEDYISTIIESAVYKAKK